MSSVTIHSIIRTFSTCLDAFDWGFRKIVSAQRRPTEASERLPKKAEDFDALSHVAALLLVRSVNERFSLGVEEPRQRTASIHQSKAVLRRHCDFRPRCDRRGIERYLLDDPNIDSVFYAHVASRQ